MSYITLQDLTRRFGESEILALADDGTGQVDQEEIDRAIEDAGGEIDGYVAGGGYTVPLSPVPKIVASYACDIARYRLYDDAATEQVTKRYEDAIRFLRMVAKGEVLLGIGTEDGGETAGNVEFQVGKRVMPGGGF
ncbi:MAG: gp436 family protein [Pseudomonadota bacterium]